MSETGKIVADAVKKGYRGFLTKIHPDYFVGHVAAQKVNISLIQMMERPVETILQSWLTESPIYMRQMACKVEFYLKKNDGVSLKTKLMPFSMQDKVHLGSINPKLFKNIVTQSMLGLFQDANVGIEPEIFRFLSRELSFSLKDEDDLEKGKFAEFLDDFFQNQQTPKPPKATAIPRILTMPFIRFDKDLTKAEKIQAVISLCDSVEEIEGAQVHLGIDMPILFISSSMEFSALTRDSIKLAPNFTPSGIL